MSYNTHEKQHQYNHSIKRKRVIERFRKKHPNYLKIWNANHPDYYKTPERKQHYHDKLMTWRQTSHGKILFKKAIDKYNRSEKGRLNSKRHAAKRFRNLKFIPISDNILLEKTVWHHIDNTHVALIPEDLHTLYFTKDIEVHQFMCNQIVKQLYNEEVIILCKTLS